MYILQHVPQGEISPKEFVLGCTEELKTFHTYVRNYFPSDSKECREWTNFVDHIAPQSDDVLAHIAM